MSELITTLEPEDRFPFEDIGVANANLLGVMLASPRVINQAHIAAESTVLLYRIGHRLLNESIGDKCWSEDVRHAEVFNHGISVYEAISAFVRPLGAEHNIAKARLVLGQLLEISTDKLFEVMTQAEADIATGYPNMNDVLAESTSYTHPGMEVYATFGLALARQIELQVTD